MLQAKLKNGLLVTLATLTKREIERHRGDHFFCPICDAKVIVKAGNKVVPHFAHEAKHDCPSGEGGEGSYHERGKLLLYYWLRSQNINVKLEKYIREINQRSDLLLEINNKQIAIEYQCTRTTIEQIRLRNKGYKRAGVIPIWILGANRFKRQGKYKLRIDEYTKQFIHHFSTASPSILFYFCSTTSQFITFQHIHFTTNQQAIGKFTFSQINNRRFTDIFSIQKFTKQELYTMWANKKRRFRTRRQARPYGRELTWLQWLYQKKTHVEYLPSIVYLPISTQWQMRSPPWDWQSRLVIDVIDPMPLKGYFSLTLCKRVLRKHMNNSSMLPLIYPSKNPIIQYLHLLEELKIIKQISPDKYIKINQITFQKNIEDSLQADKTVMNELISALSIK